jgi:hypothetical protein
MIPGHFLAAAWIATNLACAEIDSIPTPERDEI